MVVINYLTATPRHTNPAGLEEKSGIFSACSRCFESALKGIQEKSTGVKAFLLDQCSRKVLITARSISFVFLVASMLIITAFPTFAFLLGPVVMPTMVASAACGLTSHWLIHQKDIIETENEMKHVNECFSHP